MDPLSSGHYLHFFHSVTTSFIYYSMFLNTVFSCNLGCLFLVQFFSLSRVNFVDFIFPFHTQKKWGFFSLLLNLSSFIESLGPFVVVTLVGPADAPWPLTPAGRYPQSCAAGNRIFPSLVLSILSLRDHGSQDIPLSQIDKQSLADPPLLICLIHPQLIDYNHQVTLALTLMLVVEMKVSKLWRLTDVCVHVYMCVCKCIHVRMCV